MRVKDVRILSIAPRTRDPGHEYYTYVMPVGIAYISSMLKKNGYVVDLLNLNHSGGDAEEIIRTTLSSEKYDYILTGGLSVHYTAVKYCVDTARKYAPAARVILGGGLISSLPELMFKALRPDYIVIHEGELTIVELLKHLENNRDLTSVPGIGYRGPGDTLVITKDRLPIQDLDSLPWPDYEGLGFGEYLDKILPSTLYYYDIFDNPRPYPLIASRSCPYQCTFCYHPIGNIYRQRSIASIMDEIIFAVERYKINLIDIYDELFSHDRERVFEFCKQLKQVVKSVPWEIKWSCQMRVDRMDKELVAIMKNAGCYAVSLGLESYSAKVLKSMRKKITPEQIETALQICHDLQMTVQGNFIFGDISETKETAYQTLYYWKRRHAFLGEAVSLGFIEVYPGTALYEHCVKKGIIKDQLDFIENHLLEPINITDNMTAQEWKQLCKDVTYTRIKYSISVSPKIVRINNNIFETHVKCPYCHFVSVYRNYVPPGRNSYPRKDICCRNCRMRFYLVSRHQKLKNCMSKLIGSKGWFLLYPVWRRMKKKMSNIKRRIRFCSSSTPTTGS